MSEAVLIADHVNQALARLHEQHKGKTNIEALLTALTSPIQDIEAAMIQLLLERTIDTAIGVQLDVIGKIVGQPRNGLSDDDYRRHVRARIATSNSKARVADLIVVSRLVLDDPTTAIEVDQTGAAAVVTRLAGTLVTDTVAGFLMDFLRDTAAAGVRIHLQYLQAAEANSFQFGAVTLLSGAHSIGATTLTVDSTNGYEDTGTLTLSEGLAAEEDVTYTSKSATQFFGVSSLTNNHLDDATVEIADDEDKGWGAAGTMNGAHSIGATTINYFDLDADTISRFPASGSLLLSEQLAAEETVTYTGRTATQFTGVSSLVNDHLANATITGSGGAFMSALE